MHRLSWICVGQSAPSSPRAKNGLKVLAGVLLAGAAAVGCGDSSSDHAGDIASASATDAGASDAGSAADSCAPGVVSSCTASTVPGSCQVGSLTACTSFTTPTGTTLQLGPYGALMEANVGKGFENEVQMADKPGSSATCSAFTSIFGEDPKLTAQLLQTTIDGLTLDFALYTVYRPATWKAGETYPVITWGNGTCAQPEGYGALLRFVASHGYVIIAANSRWVGMGSPAPMLHALDYAAAANADPASPYYQKLDLTKVGAMGHSQGGAATVSAVSDARISSAIVFNASDTNVAKPYLAISGDADITGFTPASMAMDINASAVAAAYLYYHNPAGMGPIKGHLLLMLSPDRVTGPTLAYWQMMLRNDADSRTWFQGTNCKLCNQAMDFEFGTHSLN